MMNSLMKIALIGIGLLAVALLIAGLFGGMRFARRAQDLTGQLTGAVLPVDISAELPARVRDFALRADARPGDLARSVTFSQTAEMQLKPGAPWQPLEAVQTVAIGEAGFVWQARQSLGPWPKFQVVDAFVAGQGSLRVRLLGLLGIVNATGPEVSYGEALRYLAELPWAPDAILGNPAIRWCEIDEEWVAASIDVAGRPATVRFRFNGGGDIAEVFADARETIDDQGNPASYPWQGFFRDYRMIGPRRIPSEGEVGYVRPSGYRPYFQGRITGYDAAH